MKEREWQIWCIGGKHPLDAPYPEGVSWGWAYCDGVAHMFHYIYGDRSFDVWPFPCDGSCRAWPAGMPEAFNEFKYWHVSRRQADGTYAESVIERT